MAQHRSYSTHVREMAVPLMSKDELRRMSKRRFIVLPLGEKPIFARKNFFFADRFLMQFAHRPLPRSFKLPNIERGLGRSIFDHTASPQPAPAHTPRATVAGQSRARLKPGSIFLAQVDSTSGQSTPAPPRQPGAAFQVGLALETRRRRTAAADESSAPPDWTAPPPLLAIMSLRSRRDCGPGPSSPSEISRRWVGLRPRLVRPNLTSIWISVAATRGRRWRAR
jgi:hypothetical protein